MHLRQDPLEGLVILLLAEYPPTLHRAVQHVVSMSVRRCRPVGVWACQESTTLVRSTQSKTPDPFAFSFAFSRPLRIFPPLGRSRNHRPTAGRRAMLRCTLRCTGRARFFKRGSCEPLFTSGSISPVRRQRADRWRTAYSGKSRPGADGLLRKEPTRGDGLKTGLSHALRCSRGAWWPWVVSRKSGHTRCTRASVVAGQSHWEQVGRPRQTMEKSYEAANISGRWISLVRQRFPMTAGVVRPTFQPFVVQRVDLYAITLAFWRPPTRVPAPNAAEEDTCRSVG